MNSHELTRSGLLCLEELVQIAILSYGAPIASEWLVVTSTTCVEAHFDRLINALIASSRVSDSKFASALLDDNYEEIFKTWDSRLKWLDKGFGIGIAGDRPVQDYRTLVDLRNAVVHGQGHLTLFQQRNFAKFLALKQSLARLFDVNFMGTAVIFTDALHFKVIEACRLVVAHLDRAVLNLYPEIAGMLISSL
jgi:hypothetical protein